MRQDGQRSGTGTTDARVRNRTLLGLLGLGLALMLGVVRASPGLGDDVAAALLLAAAGAALLLLWPALDYRLVEAPMAPLVALVGCDGSGKSTLAGDMVRQWGASRRVRACYLGLGSGAIGARIRGWPLVGPALERRLAGKAARSRTRGATIPGLPTALAIYLLSLLRLRRFKRMLRLRRAGIPVLTDRYPQVEVPGFYDGPGLAAAAAGSRTVALLVECERRIYAWMAAFRPDVVVRLNIDAATALARKPDHGRDLIGRKVAVTPTLRFSGARIVDLDAGRPYPAVRRDVAAIVGDALARRAP